MNARRSRIDSTQRLADFRRWGCVVLAMFAVVQAARGYIVPTAPPVPVSCDNTHFPLASIASIPAAHVVSINANTAVATFVRLARGACARDSRIQKP